MSESGNRPRSAGGRVAEGEMETSLAEKILALVLAVFIAIGAIWGYVKLDEVAEKDSTSYYAPDQKLIEPEELSAIQSHRQAIRSVPELALSPRRARLDRSHCGSCLRHGRGLHR